MKVIARKISVPTSPFEYGDAPECVYVFGNDRLKGIRDEEITEIKNALEAIAEDYDDLTHGRLYDNNLHAILWYHLPRENGVGYSREERKTIVRIAQEYLDGTDDADGLRAICDALEMVHGIAFDWYEIHGCCQGDWQTAIVPMRWSLKDVENLEIEYFNLGEEYVVDDEYGIYVLRDAATEIADYYGCDPDDVEIA
jgi:hypothetical protein